jgi:uncharacterized protein (TIGR03118 family)
MRTRIGSAASLRRRPPARRRTGYRLTLEALEARAVPANSFLQTNLLSDISGIAQNTDTHTPPQLLNPWGLAEGPTGPFWVSDNGSGLSTLYNGAGQQQALTVTIPPPNGSPPGTLATPTGAVFNGSPTDFVVTANGKSGPASFLFATEDGTISGWNFGVNKNNAIRMVDNSGAGAVYKGLTLGTDPDGRDLIYAANFHDGTIDVFDTHFRPTEVGGSFADARIPADFAPFNVQNLNGLLYVTYAKQKPGKHDDLAGPGNGFVDVFTTNGKLVTRLASNGPLNSPWGLAIAPPGFGDFGGDLLIGNFGDGRINIFDPQSGHFRGQLDDPLGRPVTIGGLWALHFGNGSAVGGDARTLYFTAGLNDEADGLFGSLRATHPVTAGSNSSPLFLQTNLVSDVVGLARTPDANLVNPWGLTAGPTTPFWVSDNGAGVSTLYNGSGQPQPAGSPLTVTIPAPAGATGGPTGVVFNGGGGFNVTANGKTGSSMFLFASDTDTISGWSPRVDRNNAVIAVPHSAAGASYTGLALATNGGQTLLYAANEGQGTIDVFNSSFTPVVLGPHPFQDPNLPAGLMPYNIQLINGQLYVTYEKPDGGVPGDGAIDIFRTDGVLVRRFATGGPLFSPWGLALAPAGFGRYGGDLLVGNEEDGHINVYSPKGIFIDQLRDLSGKPIVIGGLWGLMFGNNNVAGNSNTLFFNAGIGDYHHGLFGSLQPVS